MSNKIGIYCLLNMYVYNLKSVSPTAAFGEFDAVKGHS